MFHFFPSIAFLNEWTMREYEIGAPFFILFSCGLRGNPSFISPVWNGMHGVYFAYVTSHTFDRYSHRWITKLGTRKPIPTNETPLKYTVLLIFWTICGNIRVKHGFIFILTNDTHSAERVCAERQTTSRPPGLVTYAMPEMTRLLISHITFYSLNTYISNWVAFKSNYIPERSVQCPESAINAHGKKTLDKVGEHTHTHTCTSQAHANIWSGIKGAYWNIRLRQIEEGGTFNSYYVLPLRNKIKLNESSLLVDVEIFLHDEWASKIPVFFF